jgi:hypothetical protein
MLKLKASYQLFGVAPLTARPASAGRRDFRGLAQDSLHLEISSAMAHA